MFDFVDTMLGFDACAIYSGYIIITARSSLIVFYWRR